MPITPEANLPEEAIEESEVESEGEITATADLEMLQGQDVSPGDRVELEVVSVDPDMGSVVLRYPKKEAPPEGIESMAAEYDEPMES